MTQKIRPSQFILVYGPGAILEGRDGPRLIPDAGIGLFHPSGFRPEDYRIDDKRMSEGLLDGAKIYRLPTNPELGHEGDVYRTAPFPVWKICPNQNHGGGSLIYREDLCPVCKDAETGGGRAAVGFVMACGDGHLDEINWFGMVHRGAACAGKTGSLHPGLSGDAVRWHRRGSTMSDVVLECPRCGTTQQFGRIYYSEWPCRGRHPQREYGGSERSSEACKRKAKVITRRASNLRLPETRTLLSIRSTNTSLNLHLQNSDIQTALMFQPARSKGKMMKVLEKLHSAGKIRKDVLDEFRESDWSEIRQAVEEHGKIRPRPYHDLIMDEFHELVKASVHGAPPQEAERPKAKIIFEIEPREIGIVRTKKGTAFRITPVQTLRTVTVQTGFRRDMPESVGSAPPKLVRIGHSRQGSGLWFPGVEFFGEGVFVRLDKDCGWSGCAKGAHAGAWTGGAAGAGQYSGFVFRDADSSRDELDPGFVWWHTVSHLLIRAIGEEAGYSPASIRERVYFERDGGRCRGGVLLYATQPGNEGTLGGLIGLAPHMEKILRAALEKASSCSGDPLCGDAEFRSGGYSGASCYACLMTSETSCEHRNMWLDRHVLLDNLP